MIQIVFILIGIVLVFVFGIRLVLTIMLSFVGGLILATLVENLNEYLDVGKDDFSPVHLLPSVVCLGIALALAMTAPARARLHLFLVAGVFTVFGYLMLNENIFKHGVGDCSLLALGVCAAGLALVITYPRGNPTPPPSRAGRKADAGGARPAVGG
jgi:hypothetical protein